ncbi:YcxB family protein [Streptomyces sp. NRRL F-5123]|uniref:YcxB family protein n=1 Tax=Streptomyces sp. NRRL F-5123 TaxID=1463856 RepID=UPI0004E1CA1F|nr:YcxB family protein [Streptomyces sp. NRRL F-5123]
MDIQIEGHMTVEDITAASFHIQRWEMMRITPGAVVLAVVAVLTAFTVPVVAVVCGLGLAVVVGLHLKWRRDARQIAAGAVRLADPFSVRFTDSKATFAQNGTESAYPWDKIAYVTRSDAAWIVVPGDPREVFMLPHRALSPSQTAEFTRLLSSWPQRKYRKARLPAPRMPRF